MIKTSLLLFIVALVIKSQNCFAELIPYGLQCSSTETSDLNNCLKRESGKIDEANQANEIILTSEEDGKQSLLKLISGITSTRNDDYSAKLTGFIPLIESSVATALIIQYENEPQLYFYAIDKNGKLEVIFDGLNSVDITKTHKALFDNEPDVFYLKSKNISKAFTDWLSSLKEY